MERIEIATSIGASIEACFDAARDLELHIKSTAGTQERIVAGRSSGLCELNDEVTWEATHFFVRQRLSSRITQFNRPHFFEDTMLQGAFKSMRHEHHFETTPEGTVMRDVFFYEVPYGWLGKIFNALLLKKYMTRFLQKRAKVLKEVVENR